jgi:hypothetical protein
MTDEFPAVGDIFEQRYELLEALGSGGAGTVFKASLRNFPGRPAGYQEQFM